MSGVLSKAKILFGVRNDGPDAYVRAKAPAMVLRYRGVDTTCRAPVLGVDADEFDILIMQRHVTPLAELIMREFQEKGKPVVYDVDDWLFALPPSWPAYKDFFNAGRGVPKPALEFHERLLMRADMVTCTTPALAEKLAIYNETVRILPNCVLMGDWDTVLPTEHNIDGFVIGWFGSLNHLDNWRSIATAVDQSLVGTNGRLAILGLPEIAHLVPERLIEKTFIQPAVRFRDFGRFRRLIRSFDLGLAWLDDTPINLCKSPLKILQYGAAGVPVVASRMVYGEILGDTDCLSDVSVTEYGIVVRHPRGLKMAFSEIMRHPGKMKRKAAAWQQHVWENHSYETQHWRWAEIIEEALSL